MEYLNNTPIAFRKNIGQWDNSILYRGYTRGWDAGVAFLKNEISYRFLKEGGESSGVDNAKGMQQLVWNTQFKNANPGVIVNAGQGWPSVYNYIRHSANYLNVPEHPYVKYENIYSDIDIAYYLDGDKLKHDFAIHPHANIHDVQIECKGVKSISINRSGQLEISTNWGTLVEAMPESYQLIEGKKVSVEVKYKLIDEYTYGFSIEGKYSKNHTLIIDPIVMDWCTFLTTKTKAIIGGNNYAHNIDVDDAGFAYVVGFINEDFDPTPGVVDGSYNGPSPNALGGDVMVVKMNQAGTAFVYATYIGGGDVDRAHAVRVKNGIAHVTGITASNNFPTTVGAYDNTTNNNGDVFALKLNATGTALLYSTYIGGNQFEQGYGIDVDAGGNMYVSGNTWSSNFPTKGAFDATFNGGFCDAFAVKLNPAGGGATDLVYSTFIGGNGYDRGTECAVNAAGEIHLTGTTASTNFPTQSAAFGAYGGGNHDAFITKLNAAGNGLVFSTYLGGSGDEYAVPVNGLGNGPMYGGEYGDIVVNAIGDVFVVGTTGSANFPVTAGVYDNSLNGTLDAFVAKFTSSGTLSNATYIGTAAGETRGFGLDINSNNEVFISGNTLNNFPTTTCGFDQSFNSAQAFQPDFFLCKFNTTLSTLLYSTYIGGSEYEYNSPKVALIDKECFEEVYMAGTVHSKTGFPVTAGAYQTVHQYSNGADEPAAWKFKPDIVPDFNYIQVVDCQVPVQFNDLTTGNCIWQNGAWTPTAWFWDFGDGSTSTQQNPTHTYASAGNYQVKLVVSCPKDSIIKTINVNPGPNCICTIDADSAITHASCQQPNGSAIISVQNASPPITYTWSPNVSVTNTANNIASGNYTVYVSESGGCKDTVLFTINDTPLPALTYTVTHVSCPGLTDGAIDLTVSSGTSPYGYNWSNNAFTEDLNNIGANTYDIIVTDVNGCTADTSIIVNEPSPQNMQVVAGVATTICIGDSAQLSAMVNPAGQYNYTWNPGNIVGNPIWVKPLVTTEYTVSVSDNCGNPPVTDEVEVTVSPIPLAVMVADDTVGCEPLCVSFSDNGPGGYDCYWTFGDGKGAAGCNLKYCYSNSGVYSVTLSITDANGCSNTFSKPNWITVYENPIAGFTANPEETTTYYPDIHFTDVSQYATNWYWYFGDGDSLVDGTQNPTHQYPDEDAGEYTVMQVVENAIGCVDTAYREIKIKTDWSFYIPNTFTPNGDKYNNGFIGKGVNINEYEMWIFDRWGNEIYHCTSLNDPWDGRVQNGASGEIAQIDTYVWVVQLKDNLNKPHRFVGHVNLIK